MIHSSLTAVRCFGNGYVGKQPASLEEYCVEYWLKELQERMDRSTGRCNRTEILFNPFLNKPWFLRVCRTSLLKTLGKGEIARNKQFLLFLVFSTHLKNSAIFITFEIAVCKLLQFGRV